MHLTRLRRLLNLIGLLQGGREHNIESLAHACGVSRRTVFRDLDLLKQADVPLFFHPERQRYSIGATYYQPPASFTTEEALALVVLCHELGDPSQLPFFSPARSAVVKIEATLPAKLREHLRCVSGAIHIEADSHAPLEHHQPFYDELLRAIAAQRCVRIEYHSPIETKPMITKLHPYRLVYSRRSWYIIGRSSLHRSARTFNVNRIHKLEVLDESFQTPASFSLDRYLGNAWRLIPEPGPDRDVQIRFSPLVARNVAEITWHKTQRTSFNADGSLDFRCTVSGLREISWWILGYGAEAEVLAPQELRAIIAENLARMAKQYGCGDSQNAGKRVE